MHSLDGWMCFLFFLSFLTGDSNCAFTRCRAIGCDAFSAFRQSTAFTKCPTTPICSPKWKKNKSSSASPPFFHSRFSLLLSFWNPSSFWITAPCCSQPLHPRCATQQLHPFGTVGTIKEGPKKKKAVYARVLSLVCEMIAKNKSAVAREKDY